MSDAEIESSIDELLRSACRAGQSDLALALVDQGANPFDVSPWDTTAMDLAINKAPPLAYEILRRPCVADAINQELLNQHLFKAINASIIRLTGLLIAMGADVDDAVRVYEQSGRIVDPWMRWVLSKPLHAAASMGHTEVCLVLLEAGHDPRETCSRSNAPCTPLDLAVGGNWPDTARVIDAWMAHEAACAAIRLMPGAQHAPAQTSLGAA